MSSQPDEDLRDLLTGIPVAASVGALVGLGVIDALTEGPLAEVELARRLEVEDRRLHWLLRTGEAVGVLTEDDAGCCLTPAGRSLSSDHPSSLRAVALAHYRLIAPMAMALERAVRSGRSPGEEAFNAPLYDHLDAHPADDRLYSDFMEATLDASLGDLFEGLRPLWAGGKLVVDIGAGPGSFARRVLEDDDDATVIVVDRHGPIAHAAVALASFGPRVRVVIGDGISGCPPDGDLYVLCRVLQNWDMAGKRAFLDAAAAVMPADAKCLVLEHCDDGSSRGAVGGLLNHLLGGVVLAPVEQLDLFSSAGFDCEQQLITAGWGAWVLTLR